MCIGEHPNLKPTCRTHLCPGDHLHEDKLTSSEVLAWRHSEPRRKKRFNRYTLRTIFDLLNAICFSLQVSAWRIGQIHEKLIVRNLFYINIPDYMFPGRIQDAIDHVSPQNYE